MKKKGRPAVPRAKLREKYDNIFQREEKEADPWSLETGKREAKNSWEAFPFVVFKEMHDHMFPKLLGCLAVIVFLLFLNVLDLPVTNKIKDRLLNVVSTNLDFAAIPGKVENVISFVREKGIFQPDESENQEQDNQEMGYPVLNPTVISEYGMREDSEGRTEMNYGIDLAVEAGSPVRAVLAGRVIRLEDYDGSGVAVMLDHGSGLSTYYARLEEVNLEEDDTVKAGDMIGKVSSGGVEGEASFLHFEVWVDGRPVNPSEALTGN